ncbi:MAG: winged helix DNA-binding domain-containing protein [bacterium]|nr:winged helix DNA-binding domain-containing protein [bacterium]
MPGLNKSIAYQRLRNQRILGSKVDTPEDVVRGMGAMQAQDYHQAVWAVALRTNGGTLTDVEQAIADGKIICTWPMRGTIHFIPPENVRWMLRLFASRVIKGIGRRMAQLNLTQDDLLRSQELCEKALANGVCLTRSSLLDLFEASNLSARGPRGYHILTQLAQRGVLCQGPRQGKEQTFTLLDTWVAEAETLSDEDALAKLATLYFTTHGPATAQDFAWWTGSTLTDARKGIQGAVPALQCEKIERIEYYKALNQDDESFESSVWLLPGYDEYILGYKDRSAVLREGDINYVVPGSNGVFRPMIVVNGQIAGTWTKMLKKRHLDINLEPFLPMSDVQLEMAASEAERYGVFHGLPTSLKVIS